MTELDNSPLIQYALKGLDRCWLPQYHRWSHIYHLDGRPQPNESIPESDVFYTLNVLLGASRVRRVPQNVDIPEIFERNASQLPILPVRMYAFGVALWASAQLELELPDNTARYIDDLLSSRSNWQSFRAQDLGMILAGAAARGRFDRKKWMPLAASLFDFLVTRYRSRSVLFYDAAFGPRRRFASFATQTYLTLACYLYGEIANDERAITIGNSCSRKLINLQGPNGEWPWFFDAAKGSIVDFYEVYSVHQYGMAPAFLELAERHGVPEARNALIKGFKWVFGKNQLGAPMLVPKLHLSIRSQVRKGELSSKKRRAFRAVRSLVARPPSGLIDSTSIELRLECRSYELGWILWSFGQRSDLHELTDNPLFIGP